MMKWTYKEKTVGKEEKSKTARKQSFGTHSTFLWFSYYIWSSNFLFIFFLSLSRFFFFFFWNYKPFTTYPISPERDSILSTFISDIISIYRFLFIFLWVSLIDHSRPLLANWRFFTFMFLNSSNLILFLSHFSNVFKTIPVFR